MAEPYVAGLFVGRTAPLAQIIALAGDSDPEQRVLSVVGSPGVGKSYLLNYARDRLRAAGQLVFWVNLSRDPLIRDGCPDVVVSEQFHEWLRRAIDLASQKCDQVRSYSPASLPGQMVQTLVADLCRRCDPNLKPVLIVDGFEEISVQERDILEKDLLEPFISRQCTRIIVGRRDEFSLNSSALRWTEDRLDLSVLKDTEATQQINTRLINWSLRPYHSQQTGQLSLSANLASTLGQIDLILPYRWNHPGINIFLLERIVIHYRPGYHPYLQASDLYDCLREVTRIPSPLSNTEIELLIKLADLQPSPWTSGSLMSTLKIAIEDQLLAGLFERGIVINVPNTPTYKVADGIRELAQALHGFIAPGVNSTAPTPNS